MISPSRVCALAVGLMLAACSSGVVPAGPQTYMVSIGGRPGLGSGGASRAQAYREASAWCEKRRLVMVPVAVNQQGAVVGGRYESADLTFKALPPGHPDIQRIKAEVRVSESLAGGPLVIAPAQTHRPIAHPAFVPPVASYQAPKRYHAQPDYAGGYLIREQ